jgi:hypothetical protein
VVPCLGRTQWGQPPRQSLSHRSDLLGSDKESSAKRAAPVRSDKAYDDADDLRNFLASEGYEAHIRVLEGTA